MKKTFQKRPQHIVIFASGNGSNAQNIINYFDPDPEVIIKSVFCNNTKAKVIEKAKAQDVEVFLFDKSQLQSSDYVLNKLKSISPDLIVLAGFLLKIPDKIISLFDDKIINLHPSLLPKYGGKGMYGDRVHHAVLASGEKESGISIHYVNEVYDDGQIIAQFKTPVDNNETLKSLQEKIHQLEQQHFPKVIDKLLKDGKA